MGSGIQVQFVLGFCLGLVFLASALPKLRNPKGFILTVVEYQVLPPRLAELFARLLPPAEVFAAILLLTGTAGRIGYILAASLLASFIWAISINLARGRDLDCGCFGAAGSRRIGPGLLLQDLVLLGVSLGEAWNAGSWVGPQWWRAWQTYDTPTRDAMWLFGCFILALCCVLIVRRFSLTSRKWRGSVSQ